MRSILSWFAGIAFIASSCASNAQPISVEIVQAFVRLSFSQPTDIQNAGDGTNRLFVCEKGGRLRVFENDPNTNVANDFLDLSARVVTSSEMGLLGLAFHPDFEENGYFYVNYNIQRNDSLFTVISRFTVDDGDPDVADVSSEVVLLEFEQPYANHDGGQIAFGPDGHLYIATGDGGSGGDPHNHGQRLNSLLGKILRIDVNNPDNGMNYGIPEDNPFAESEDLEDRREIYAYGLRNPWRFSFDSENGRLWAADVGQNQYEEIDIIENGKNYGWRVMEGWHCFNPSSNCDSTGLTGPVWEYGRDLGASITGGYVYHGSDAPDLEGLYIYADFSSGRVWALEYNANENVVTENRLLEDTDFFISTFGVDEANELYFGAFNNRIYKFETATGVKHEERASDAALKNIRPNPASGQTVIPYQLTERTSVVLALYNELGEEIARLVDRKQEAGEYEVEFDAGRLTESVYYCRLTTETGTSTQRITVVQ